jgi:hypothetical protein
MKVIASKELRGNSRHLKLGLNCQTKHRILKFELKLKKLNTLFVSLYPKNCIGHTCILKIICGSAPAHLPDVLCSIPSSAKKVICGLSEIHI